MLWFRLQMEQCSQGYGLLDAFSRPTRSDSSKSKPVAASTSASSYAGGGGGWWSGCAKDSTAYQPTSEADVVNKN